jgi:hypothetical protein
MKKLFTLLLVCLLFAGYNFGQSESRTYFTSGGEMIFSFATIEDDGFSESSILRWSPVFNIQSMWNADLNKNVGFFTGLAIRNVGFIYDGYKVDGTGEDADYTVKKKFRSYNLAIPVGVKLGNLDKMFVYAGYEVEFPFHYKEKTFVGGDKTSTIQGWFSDRQEKIQHGFLVGIQFPEGLSLKFKYYLSNFHNENFTESNGNKPYNGLKANVFYFSLSSYLFRNMDFDKPEPKNIY